MFPLYGLNFCTGKELLLFLEVVCMSADSNNLSLGFLPSPSPPIWTQKADQLYVFLLSDDKVPGVWHSAYLIHLGF